MLFSKFADIDHSHPDVEKDLNDWGVWVLKETGAEGFRFDAVKVRSASRGSPSGRVVN